MLFSILIVAVIIGLIRGGKITNMMEIKIRYPWLIFSSVMVEFGLLILMRNTTFITQPMVFAAVFIQYLLLCVFLWLNRHLPFIWLVGVGSLLNLLVIMVNKGSMPLSNAAALLDSNSKDLQYLLNGQFLTYHLINEKTKLWFLGDVIYIPPPFNVFLSIGDIILFIGILLLIQSIIAGKASLLDKSQIKKKQP
jgi:hypothetical protein